MLGRHGDVQRHPRRDRHHLLARAVDRDAQGDGPALDLVGHGALILDAQADRHGLADQAEGGGFLDDKAAIPVRGLACQQHMDRRGGGRWQRGGVVQLPVGDDDGARDACLGLGGQRAGHRLAQARAVGIVADRDAAQLGPRPCCQAFGKGVRRRAGLFGAARQGLACALVLDQQHDVRKAPAHARFQRRPRQRGGGRQPRETPPRPAAQAPPPGQPRRQQRQRHQRRHEGPGQKRIEAQPRHGSSPGTWRGGGSPCSRPSRSSSSGTWTWSDL